MAEVKLKTEVVHAAKIDPSGFLPAGFGGLQADLDLSLKFVERADGPPDSAWHGLGELDQFLNSMTGLTFPKARILSVYSVPVGVNTEELYDELAKRAEVVVERQPDIGDLYAASPLAGIIVRSSDVNFLRGMPLDPLEGFET